MQFFLHCSLKFIKITLKTRRKLAEISKPSNPWGIRPQGTFFEDLALGTIGGVVVAPQILDFSVEKSTPKFPLPKIKKRPFQVFSLIRGLYSSKLKAVPHPSHESDLLATRFQLPNALEASHHRPYR